MSFSLSGNIITQAGTDADLTGLGDISGVVVTTSGTFADQTFGQHKTYDLGDYELHISGTLTQNANKETLQFGYGVNSKALTVLSGGTYNASAEYSERGHTDVFTHAVALICNRHDHIVWIDTTRNYGLRAEPGSTVNLRGVTLKSRNNIVFNGNGSVEDITFVARNFNQPLLNLKTLTTTFDKILVIGGGAIQNHAQGTYSGVSGKSLGLAFQGGNSDVGWTSTSLVTAFATLVDYVKSGGITIDIRFHWNQPWKLRNAALGTDLIFSNTGSGGQLTGGFAWFTKDVSVTAVDIANTALEGVKTYMSDTDHGARVSAQSKGFTNAALTAQIPDFSQGYDYAWTTDASGAAAAQEVTIGVAMRAEGDPNLQINYDYRGKNNDTSDLFDFKQYKYGYLINDLSNQELKGTGTFELSGTLFRNSAITEDAKAVVDAYAQIDTAAKFYDKAASFLEDNWGTYTDFIVTRSGDTIDAGAYDVVVDATAPAPFAFDGGTITIKASIFVGEIETTGTATTANGAVILSSKQFETFQAIGANETRDDSEELGVQYFLDGNTADGRLNIAPSGRWIVGDNTHIVYSGPSNHTFMRGVIQSDALTLIAAQTSGRVDFSSVPGGMQANDITYVYANEAGSTYNHLEGVNNAFTGFVRFVFQMGSTAIGSVQFGQREYANVELTVRDTNEGTVKVFPARSGDGFSSFPNFKVVGSIPEVVLSKGGNAVGAHGRFYDPVYEGYANNFIPMYIDDYNGDRSSAGVGHSIEYFTLDLTNVMHADLRCRIVEDGVEAFNGPVTAENTVIYQNDGVSTLSYYEGRNVLPIKVREIIDNTSNNRHVSSYRLRQKGKLEAAEVDRVFNGPIAINQMADDLDYDARIDGAAITGVAVDTGTHTITITEARTTEEIYNYLSHWLAQNLQADWFIGKDRDAVTFGAYSLVVDAVTITGAVSTTGTVALQNGASISGGIKDASGVQKSIIGLPAGADACVGAWPASQGEADRTGIVTATVTDAAQTSLSLPLTPGVDYYIVADARGYVRTRPARLPANQLSLGVALDQITDQSGAAIVPNTLDAGQQRIAEMIDFDTATGVVRHRLPDDYASDSRWDASNGIWTFTAEDFYALAHRIEQLQSSMAFLSMPGTITIRPGEFELTPSATFKLGQHPDNQARVNGAILNFNAISVHRAGSVTDTTFLDQTHGPIEISTGTPFFASIDTDALAGQVDTLLGATLQSTHDHALAANVQTKHAS